MRLTLFEILFGAIVVVLAFLPIIFLVCRKLVDCLEKCLIYGHIRRFAD